MNIYQKYNKLFLFFLVTFPLFAQSGSTEENTIDWRLGFSGGAAYNITPQTTTSGIYRKAGGSYFILTDVYYKNFAGAELRYGYLPLLFYASGNLQDSLAEKATATLIARPLILSFNVRYYHFFAGAGGGLFGISSSINISKEKNISKSNYAGYFFQAGWEYEVLSGLTTSVSAEYSYIPKISESVIALQFKVLLSPLSL